MRKIILNNHGQSIIENMLAMALLIMVFFMIIDGSVQLFKIEGNTGRSSTEYEVVSQLIETIKGEPAIYQKNFITDASTSQSYLSTFPYGYGENLLYTGNPPKCDPNNPTANAVATDPNSGATDTFCDGMMTYTIQPSDSYSGLFAGKIRVEHISKDPKVPAAPDTYYNFLLNTN